MKYNHSDSYYKNKKEEAYHLEDKGDSRIKELKESPSRFMNQRRRATLPGVLKDYQKALEIYNNNKIYGQKADLTRLEKKIGDAERMLGRAKFKRFSILSIGSFILSIFFISSNLTGFAVSSSEDINNFSWLGGIFFIFGLVFTFLYFKGKSK